MRYAAGLHIPDPFIWVRLSEKEYLIVSQLEYGRARKECRPGTKVLLLDDIKLDNIRIAQRKRNLADIAAAFLLSFTATQVEIPENLWTLHTHTLQEHGIRPKLTAPFFPERLVKTAEEIGHIKSAGIAAKRAYNRAIEILRASEIEWDDTLMWKNEKVTAELLKREIESVFLENNCSSGETIVACGEQSAEPHNRGSGPILAGQPIILDLFPRHDSGYHFDMTRTVVKGTPRKELRDLYAAVKKAQQEALNVIAPGKAKGVHEAVEEVFSRLGYKTTSEEGFIHGTGHGLGIDIHETPRISGKSDDELRPGMVVTVEPGLYYADLGGVRIEDTVLITKEGCTNLTNVPKTLVVR